MASGKVLVIGATGAVGGSLLKQLLALPHPPAIRVSTRESSKATFPPNVEVVQGDLLDPSSYGRLFRGVERAFLYAKATAPLQQLCAAAKEEGIQRMVLLSSYTAQTNPEIELGKAHKKVEDAIVDAGLSYTFIRAGPFTSNIRQQWLPMMVQAGKVILTYPQAHIATVSGDDLAAVAVSALTTDELLNRAELVTGPDSITQEERVATVNRLREGAGKKPVEMVALPPQDWKATVSRGGMPEALADQLIKWFSEADGKVATTYPSDRFSDKPSQTFEQWLELNSAEFLSF
jgi:uncharacterized protein YbjT (DUF2867 family)